MISIITKIACGTLLALAASVPALAQNANFGTMMLAPGFSESAATVAGSTGGIFSLSSIANRDRDNNLCLGFGSDRDVPDYIMVLQQDFAQLNIRVRSRQNQTTLLIQGPGGVRCGDDSISGANWPAGSYRIWIGAKESGGQSDYTLLVRQ